MKVETGGGGREVEDEERFGQVVGWQRGGERLEGETGKGGGRQVQEVFIKLGSQLRLVCSLRRATAKPTFLFWYLNCPPPLFTSSSCIFSYRFHNDSMVNYEGGKGRIEVQRHTSGWGSTLLVNFDTC